MAILPVMNVIVMNNQARSLVNFWTVLLRRMIARGHTVTCLVPEGDPEGDAALRALGARVRHYPLDRKGLNPVRDAATFLALYRLFRGASPGERPDLLYASTIKPVIYGLPAAALAGVGRRYAMITGLGYMFEADNPVKKLLTALAALLYRFSLSFARAVFFQNADDISEFRRRHCLGKRTNVVPTRGTGVDTARFTPAPLPEGPPVFLLVARLLEAKGLYDFAEAARLVKKKHPEARFQLLGPPEEGRGGVPLETVRAWEREGLVEYLGQTRDVRPHVAAATVVALPSWREGMPGSLMEGMSMGRPIVATDAPGCREVTLHGQNGLLVPPRSPQALAEALAAFADDPGLAARMGREGRRLAEQEFDADKAADHLLDVMGLAPCRGAPDLRKSGTRSDA